MATNDASKLTSQGYHAYRKANDQVKGAKAPQGIDATMALTSQSDLKVAFEMLDVNKEGTLGKKQARDFLRCAGWCLPDDDLAKISRERVLEFISQDHDLTEADIDQVLGAVGMGGAKLIDCDQLAAKLLDRICNPPSVLEMHELGT
ncbi:unnamed protein product [Effrenium voratum]|nr:unnamed protein product [Effrenium voratum]